MPVIFYGCPSNDVDDPLETRIIHLSNQGKPWKAVTITKDGVDVTSQFSGFMLTFGANTYSSTSGFVSVWPASGVWQYYNEDPDTILRDDGVMIFLSPVTDMNLTLIFTVADTGGRLAGISGEYIFLMSNN